MAVTLKEVAQQAQISVPAASLILNGKGDIYSKDTNERVQQAARTLGYRPNLAARAARSGKFNAVGLLMSDHPAYSRLSVKLLQSVMAKLSDKEMHLTMSQMTDAQFTDSKFLPRMLRQHMVDGIIAGFFGDDNLVPNSATNGYIAQFTRRMAKVQKELETTVRDINKASVIAIEQKLGRVGTILSGTKPLKVVVDNKKVQIKIKLDVHLDTHDIASGIYNAKGGSYFEPKLDRNKSASGFKPLE